MFSKFKASYRRLPSDHDDAYAFNASGDGDAKRFPSRRFLVIVVFVETLALLFTFAYNGGQTASMTHSPRPTIYSPAKDAVEYHITKFAIGGDPKFHIPPSDELDRNWEDLYQFGISRIPKSQAALLPNKTLPIPGDEGHYIVELDVFHNLHCLNMIRKSLHSDYYTHMAMNVHENGPHMDHCVDWLRQSLMCAGDTSVIVWQWDEMEQKNKFQGDIAHTCRSFEKLRDWGMEHAMNIQYDPYIRLKDDGIEIPVIHG
ncbi:hypothetical protein PQX77_002475 [Marasmius sp. AFHP31]|nr:hypothetical protein PQX77_002475 [Marasmius sp. AFHP31]